MGVTHMTQSRFDFRLSRLLMLALLLVHGLAMLAMFLLPLSFLMRATLLLILAANLWFALKHRSAAGSVAGLRIESDRVVLLHAGGGEMSGQLLPDSLVTPYLAVLQIRTESNHRRVLIMPDTLDAQSFRRLRILLRWQDQLKV